MIWPFSIDDYGLLLLSFSFFLLFSNSRLFVSKNPVKKVQILNFTNFELFDIKKARPESRALETNYSSSGFARSESQII